MEGQRPPGLYLRPPHGELSFTGSKTALAKSREFGIEGKAWTLCSGRYAYGEVTLGQPELVGIDEFDDRFSAHRVSVNERLKWWPDAEELFLYAYEDWEPFGKPERVSVPAGVQTIMGEVKFLDGGDEMGQDIHVNINLGQGDEPNPSVTNVVNKAEPGEEYPEEKGTAVGDKIWTVDKPPDVAKNWTQEEKRKCIEAGNAVIREQGDNPEARDQAIQACIKNAGKTKKSDEKELSLSDIDTLVRAHVQETLAPKPAMMEEQASEPLPRIRNMTLTEALIEKGGEFFRLPFKVKKEGVDFGDLEPLELVPKTKGAEVFSEEFKAELVQEFDALELGDKGLSDDEKAALTSAQRRALPESSFAWVEKGPDCEKGEDGKRPLRCLHLPYKKADGSLDCARVRNARARIPQMSGVPSSAKSKIASAQEKCTAQAAKGRQDQEKDEGILYTLKKVIKENGIDVVSRIWAMIKDSEGETPLLNGDTGFKTFKEDDGQTWILTWTTNAFQDKEGEIFTTEAIENYAASAWQEIREKGEKGRLDFWHVPGSEFGTIRWVGAVGRFLAELSTFDDNEVAQAFKEFFEGCPEAQAEIAPDGWKASHRYGYREGDRGDGIYEWFDKDRTSVLPSHRAANPYTSMEVMKMLTTEQTESLKKIGEAVGIDLLDWVTKRGEAETKRLEEAGVAHKDIEETEVLEGEEESKVEMDVGEAAEAIQTIADAVAERFQLQGLSKTLETMVQTQEAQGKKLDELAEKAIEAEKGDLERLAEQERWTPMWSANRASQAQETVLDDKDVKDSELKAKEPKVPMVIQAVTDKITGGK